MAGLSLSFLYRLLRGIPINVDKKDSALAAAWMQGRRVRFEVWAATGPMLGSRRRPHSASGEGACCELRALTRYGRCIAKRCDRLGRNHRSFVAF